MTKILLSFVLLIIYQPIKAQSLAEEIGFINHLYETKLYEEGIFFLQSLSKNEQLNQNQKDSIVILIAKNYYQLNTDSAIRYLGLISHSSHPQFNSAYKTKALIELKNNSFQQSLKSLEQINNSDSYCNCLEIFNKYSLSVHDKRSKRNTQSNYRDQLDKCNVFVKNTADLSKSMDELEKLNRKSAMLAGLMSAAVPGLGRVYSGKPKQGLASFSVLAIWGLQSAEAYFKKGYKDPRFIAFGSIFSVFYISNIWGSALSLKIKKQEVYDQIHHHYVASLEQYIVW